MLRGPSAAYSLDDQAQRRRLSRFVYNAKENWGVGVGYDIADCYCISTRLKDTRSVQGGPQ